MPLCSCSSSLNCSETESPCLEGLATLLCPCARLPVQSGIALGSSQPYGLDPSNLKDLLVLHCNSSCAGRRLFAMYSLTILLTLTEVMILWERRHGAPHEYVGCEPQQQVSPRACEEYLKNCESFTACMRRPAQSRTNLRPKPSDLYLNRRIFQESNHGAPAPSSSLA